ncbi:unknown [Ruminococcus sp. CAG:563]|nr:unknown [Ruminococcus sp. CAG:563]DAL11135.1 MAG TPA_asm: Restriction endonuclease [Caudoviricetes sp.]DAQ25719.1 MAG TPA: Restriction endonuclease [Caudoviricetes sp.]
MDGHDYEYQVANYLRNHGYTNVKVTRVSGDY